MDKTLFIASFPDLSGFDFSKTGIKVGSVDNSDYFLNGINSDCIHSYINSLSGLVGTCDILFVPAVNSVISSLSAEGIKCIVLYPNRDGKDNFASDMRKSGFEEEYVSMVCDSWDFIISRLDKHDYEYKFVMGEDDKVLDVLKMLLKRRDVLGVSREDFDVLISDAIVNDVFSYCLLTEDEIKEGVPVVQSTFCEGIKYDYLFSSKRIMEQKDKITSLVDSIMAIEDGISVNSMNRTRDGKKWTNSFESLEKMMVLGVSNGDLVLPFPREFDQSLKGKVPYVIKSDVLGKNVTI